jgi:hypothetical protein
VAWRVHKGARPASNQASCQPPPHLLKVLSGPVKDPLPAGTRGERPRVKRAMEEALRARPASGRNPRRQPPSGVRQPRARTRGHPRRSPREPLGSRLSALMGDERAQRGGGGLLIPRHALLGGLLQHGRGADALHPRARCSRCSTRRRTPRGAWTGLISATCRFRWPTSPQPIRPRRRATRTC